MSPNRPNCSKPPYILAAEELRKNPEQWQAYESRGDCVILAGPGSGKTKTLTVKLARMLAEDVKAPRGIACITYSTECVRELRKRLSALGVEEGSRVSIKTVHSFCLSHIVIPFAQLAGLPKKYPIRVATATESDALKQIAVNGTPGKKQHWDVTYDSYRRKHLDRESPDWRADDAEIPQAIERFEALLDEQGLVDFDGMVLMGLHLVKRFPWVRKVLSAKFPILFVDEYQDLGVALDQIVQCLCIEGNMRLVAVGDPDQSIYGFTGTEPHLLQALANREGLERIELKMNYRSGPTIIQASVAALGESREFQSCRDDPGTIDLHVCKAGIEDQASYICTTLIPEALSRRKDRQLGDIVILYRNFFTGGDIAGAVEKAGWEYMRADRGNPYTRTPVVFWLEDCASWCAGGWKGSDPRLSNLLWQWLAFNRTFAADKDQRLLQRSLVGFLNSHRNPDMPLGEWLTEFATESLSDTFEREPTLRDDQVAFRGLQRSCADGNCLSHFTVSAFGRPGGAKDHLNLMTLHAAKGLEFDVVIIMALEEGIFPGYRVNTPAEVREERRLFYVGLTRARHEIHLVYSGWYYTPYGKQISAGRSRFVDELTKKLHLLENRGHSIP
ncbi:MAG: ATP-dependent helicase [Candidatus Brocadiia bacterium]